MRKIIYAASMIFVCFFCLCCVSADSSNSVNVTENDDSIEIFARFSVTGEVSDDFIGNSKTTYLDAFIDGVKNMWSGEYNGKPVNMNVEMVAPDYQGAKVKVIVRETTKPEDISWADINSGTIHLYTADGRDGLFYTGTDFIYRDVKPSVKDVMYTSGHEFGHILGLPDVYCDADKNVRKLLDTPMRTRKCLHAQDADYYMLLKYKTWDAAEGSPFTEYGSDNTIRSEFLNRREG